MPDLTLNTAAYIFFIFLAAVPVILGLRRLLRVWDEQRITRIFHKRQLQHPISTSSPVEHPLREARAQAVRSVEHRFTIIRRILILFIILIFILASIAPFLGNMSATAVSVVVAVTSIIIGIAAKPFLENFIAGIVLTFARPFRTGDTVLLDTDFYGTVEDLTMTYTIIKIWDWQRYVIPNSVMMTKNFVNLTLNDSYLWAYVEFWVEPSADLDQVRDCAIEAAENSEVFRGYEPPDFWVMELGERGVRCWVATWADSPADAWQVKSDIRIALSEKFRIMEVRPNRFFLDTNNFNPESMTPTGGS